MFSAILSRRMGAFSLPTPFLEISDNARRSARHFGWISQVGGEAVPAAWFNSLSFN